MSESTNPSTLRIGTWNTEWAKPGSSRGRRVSAELAEPDCDILCVTEGYAGVLPKGGHVIDAGQDWGYPILEGRRKVLLWSKRDWTDIDAVGSREFPNGRFVVGVTQTRTGSPLTIVGVCIPWAGAHVKSGCRNRRLWQDHEAWLVGFEKLRYRIAKSKTIVLGDFNQRIPRKWAPKRLHEALLRAFDGFEFATAGELAGVPQLVIDHIAHTPDLTLRGIRNWPKRNAQDESLSDHFGVWGECSVR